MSYTLVGKLSVSGRFPTTRTSFHYAPNTGAFFCEAPEMGKGKAKGGTSRATVGDGGVMQMLHQMGMQWAQGLTPQEKTAFASYFNSGGVVSQETTGILEKAIAKSEITKDVTLHMGHGGTTGMREARASVGKTTTTRGFAALSADKGVAMRDAGTSGTRYEIKIKAGTKGAFLPHAPGGSKSRSEVMLNKGAKFKTTGVAKVGGHTVIKMESH